MTTSPHDKLHDLINDFSVAMLVTLTGSGGMHARPMALAEVEADGTLWFLTGRHSGKVMELAQDAHVAVTMQSTSKFVSVSGSAETVEDRDRVARLWRVEWEVWFPGGPKDPDLMLLRVKANAAEYWDNSGTSGLKYLFEAGKALLTGTRPDVGEDPQIHGKILG
jgi:general stress protein 26